MSMIRDIAERKGIYTVMWDDGASLKVRRKHFAQRPLSTGDTADPEDYESSIAAIQFADAYEAALTLLDYSAKSESKLVESLVSKGYVPSAAQAAAAKLREAGLIDDRALADRLARSVSAGAVGIYAAKRKLRGKGISDEDAEAALEVLDDDQQLAAAVKTGEKFLRKYEELPLPERKRKLSQALARRGFSWDTVSSAMEKLIGGADDYD